MNITCTLKFFTTLTLTGFVLFSCGKKAQNSSSESDSDYQDTRALEPGSVTLDMTIEDENALEADSVLFNGNAWIVIPEPADIMVKSGSPMHYRTRIYFNSTEEPSVDGGYETFCEYSALASDSTYNYSFKGCYEDVDQDGTPDLLSYSPGMEFPQESGKSLRFEFIFGYSAQASELSAELEITDWF
ncbi:MAG: hypothetical protein CME62_08460 [Halobacteriovoraceae bacterium]|nr:hypothetical protein [Halobacteriovoraceae bacterium]|tara:strand:- start:9061 stop:9621 length:561 start_codon:yes stop_codon:yes gene_type:complete